MKNEALFRTGSVWKSIISMAVPSIIIILVMVLYNMADMFLWAVWAILHRWRRSPLWDRCFRSLRRWQRCLAQAAVLSLHAALARVRSSRARSAPRSASGPAFFWAFWSASVCWWAECRFWECWARMQRSSPTRSGIFRSWHWVRRFLSCPTAWRCWCVQRERQKRA